MKRKLLMLIVFLFSFSSCSSKKINLLLGYPLDVPCSLLFTSFSYENMNIASLYELICKDGELLNTKKKISSYIKNSHKIILNIGLYDILSFVKIIDGKVSYSSSLIQKKIPTALRLTMDTTLQTYSSSFPRRLSQYLHRCPVFIGGCCCIGSYPYTITSYNYFNYIK